VEKGRSYSYGEEGRRLERRNYGRNEGWKEDGKIEGRMVESCR